MTTFQDGPAEGQRLMLRRAPVFLRVVRELDTFDALDQLEDTPNARETLFAYTLTREPGRAFIDFRRGSKYPSGLYTVANYALCATQPTDEQMRDSAQWVEWVAANHHQMRIPVPVQARAPGTLEFPPKQPGQENQQQQNNNEAT